MSEIAIRVEQLGKKYIIGHQRSGDLREAFGRKVRNLFRGDGGKREEFWALKDLSFEIRRGEVVGIIGRNGAGKSTLLKILSRITDPTTGRFEIDGRVSSLLEVGTGFHAELTGRENIYLNGTILGMRRAEIKRKFDEIVAFSGVENFIDTPVKHYSSGMKVRLAFSVAAHLEPEILIIDEVLAVGDAEFQKKCLGKMDEVSKQEGRTILFVSHNLAAVEILCSSGILLKDGEVLVQGPVADVVATYIKGPEYLELAGPIQLAPDFFLKNFSFPDSTISLSNIDYEMTFLGTSNNRVSELAILVYNHLQERVAIIDFRHHDLEEKSSLKNVFTIKGSIKGLPLVEGTYYLGIFISSVFCRGDFFNLKRFEVRSGHREIIPYALRYRGYIEVESQFKID